MSRLLGSIASSRSLPSHPGHPRPLSRTGPNPIKYKRVHFIPLRDSQTVAKEVLAAQLYLQPANRVGTENHSHAFRAPLTPIVGDGTRGSATPATAAAPARHPPQRSTMVRNISAGGPCLPPRNPGPTRLAPASSTSGARAAATAAGLDPGRQARVRVMWRRVLSAVLLRVYA